MTAWPAAGPGSVVGLIWRVRDRTTFVALRRAGHRGRGGAVTVTYLAEPVTTPPRVAFAVPKAVGTAVTRNRLRRRCRESLARHDSLRAGAYLVTLRTEAAGSTPEELRNDLSEAIEAAHRQADGALR